MSNKDFRTERTCPRDINGGGLLWSLAKCCAKGTGGL